MSVISMMELNAKNPFLWDWENLVMFSSKAVEAPKKQQLVDSELDVMEGFEAASFYSSGGGRSDVGSGGSASASDLGYGSSSKSSKSASIDSSTNKEMRESLFRLDANNYSLKDPDCKRELANNPWQSKISPTTQSPIRSGESLICLKLGRTYSEDVSAGNNGKTAASVPVPVDSSTGKRSKLSSLSTEIPRCQVEGCDLDLSSAKDYHRKHRVCESHSKSPRVVVAGLERRFCQQCSRFHNISEFDQKKRSCRRRLSDHNARRRKPKPEVIQFNPMRLSSSLYDGRRQIAFNQAPVVRPRADPSSGWDFSAASKAPQASLGLFSTTQTGGHNELHLPRNEPQNYGVSKHLHHSTQLLPSKGVSNDVFSEGIQVSSTPPNLDATQNLRALSLLSTNSWGSCEPSLTSLNQPRLSNHHTRGSQPLPSMHPPPVNSEYWQGGQQAPEGAATSGLNASTPHKTDVDSNSQFQEFQLFKAPSEPSFYLY